MNDPIICKILTEATNRARKLSKINLLIGILVSIFFVSYPLFKTQRELPYGVWFIFNIDLLASPIYEIMYVIEVLITPIGCCMYIPYSNSFASYMIFSIATEKILNHQIRLIGQINIRHQEKINKSLIECIRYHKRIIR